MPTTNSHRQNDDLHGNAPDQCSVVLLLVDVINDLDFPDNDNLVRESEPLAERILGLKQRCRAAGIPTLYVNDNRGRWRSDFCAVVRECSRPGAPGRTMVERLTPADQDYVVLKPKHSAFYATPLDILLEHIGVKTIILAGVTTNACVMITASDIYIRDLKLYVPQDCVAALTDDDQRDALELMHKNFGADIRPSGELDLPALVGRDTRLE
ncbi:MAG TPA: isochorismatase family cysteine hydrolase [Terriglobales bacterium]|nr:isochorismatase family cysteine hydrolase [Terriglobales bacterium]